MEDYIISRRKIIIERHHRSIKIAFHGMKGMNVLRGVHALPVNKVDGTNVVKVCHMEVYGGRMIIDILGIVWRGEGHFQFCKAISKTMEIIEHRFNVSEGEDQLFIEAHNI